MGLGINITFTPDRAEQINGRLLALQVEIGGCMIYVGDNVIRWEPEPLWADNFDSITEALEKMIEFEAIDPVVDDFVIDGQDGKLAEWNEGFNHGFKNGLAFRNNSIPALQASLSEAEGTLSIVKRDFDERGGIIRKTREATDKLLQSTGDGIANIFDQLEKGNWVDDHGLEHNQINMARALVAAYANIDAMTLVGVTLIIAATSQPHVVVNTLANVNNIRLDNTRWVNVSRIDG